MQIIQVNILWHQNDEQDHCHSEREQKRVGLQVASLDQAQNPSNAFGSTMEAANAKARDEPLVNPVREPREHFVSGGDQKLVKLVEIKSPAHRARQNAQFFGNWITFSAAVDRVGK